VKLLHTSDWHVGKTIRGHSRADEHRAVLSEIVGIAADNDVDLIIVAGDLFETAAPTAEAEKIVYKALLELSRTGATLAVISGNHDNARRLEAVAPVLEATGDVHVLTQAMRPDDGGVRRFTARTGEDVVLAMLPFVSKRGIVRAADLWDNQAFQSSQLYTERVTQMLSLLSDEFETNAVNLLTAHTFVHGGKMGGGERQAHFIEDYTISAPSLPITANYIALGHVHRPQKISAGSPTHYCGSPLQMDFGEQDQQKQVNLVDLKPGAPGSVTPIKLSSGWPLRTLTGTFDELESTAKDLPDEVWVRVKVNEPRQAAIGDRVRDIVGTQVVDVQVIGSNVVRPKRSAASGRIGKAPTELFAEYMAEQGVEDARVGKAFEALLDAEHDEMAGR